MDTIDFTMPHKNWCATDYVNEQAGIKPLTVQEILDSLGIEFKITGSVIVVPVHVAVIHNGEAPGVGYNITDAQVQSMITAWNNDFANQSAQGSTALSTDLEVQFCLATIDPQGNPTTGITRHNGNGWIPNYSTYGIDAGGPTSVIMTDSVRWPVDQPGNSYYNVYLVTAINGNFSCAGILGYHYYPTWWINQYFGTYQIIRASGTVGNLAPCAIYNKVVPHEAGHGLNLKHTFDNTTSCTSETNCATQGDECCDTYPHNSGSTSNTCVPVCNGLENVHNYMNYTRQQCQNEFTPNQFTRTQAALLLNQWQYVIGSNKCVLSTITDFNMSNDTVCVGEWLELSSISVSGNWNLTGGVPNSANGPVTHVQYFTAGTYPIIFTTSTGSKTKNIIVKAAGCDPIPHPFANNHFGEKVQLVHCSDGETRVLGSSNTFGMEAAASISDLNGSLENYSNGRSAWDGNGNLIWNGYNGSPFSGNTVSSSQCVTVPSLGNNWLITTSDLNGNYSYGVTAYNLTTGSTTPIHPPENYHTTEGITAISYCNGDQNTWWVIVKFRNHLSPVTNQGPIADPSGLIGAYLFVDGQFVQLVTSPSFTVPNAYSGLAGVGQMNSNRAGTHLAVSDGYYNACYLYFFDRITGSITPDKVLMNNIFGYHSTGYGASFDHTGNYIYTSGNYYLRRWNVATAATDLLINGGSLYAFGQILLGADNSVYVSRVGERFLGELNGINYTEYGIIFNSPPHIYTRFGVANVIQSFFAPPICSSNPLPIELLDFKGENRVDAGATYNQLEWITATEINNSHFILEKSYDVSTWFEMAEIPGAGNSSFTNHYSFNDVFVNEKNYYRLSQVDYDGKKETFEKIVAIHIKSKKEPEVIYNLYGQVMHKKQEDLPTGVFFIKSTTITKKIVIIK